MKGLLLTVLGLALFFVVVIYLCQGRFIYFPRKYHSSTEGLARVKALSFLSGGKKQYLLLPNREGNVSPKRIWWIFSGNGSVGLDWLELTEAVKNPEVAFVLFDYPGYGFNKGSASPDRIARSIDAAIPAVAESFDLSENDLLQRSSATGHSLGCAVALDFAQRHGLNRVIAIAPFTTMAAMARRQMGTGCRSSPSPSIRQRKIRRQTARLRPPVRFDDLSRRLRQSHSPTRWDESWLPETNRTLKFDSYRFAEPGTTTLLGVSHPNW